MNWHFPKPILSDQNLGIYIVNTFDGKNHQRCLLLVMVIRDYKHQNILSGNLNTVSVVQNIQFNTKIIFFDVNNPLGKD